MRLLLVLNLHFVCAACCLLLKSLGAGRQLLLPGWLPASPKQASAVALRSASILIKFQPQFLHTKRNTRLLEDLDDLDWADSIKEMQRNWIGRSEGAEVEFKVRRQRAAGWQLYCRRRGCSSGWLRACGTAGARGWWQVQRLPGSSFVSHPPSNPKHTQLSPGEGATLPADAKLAVFTTRPDTLYGATYMVVAPEHPLLEALLSEGQRAEGKAYAEAATRKSDLERTELQKDKTGVFTGAVEGGRFRHKSNPPYQAQQSASQLQQGLEHCTHACMQACMHACMHK